MLVQTHNALDFYFILWQFKRILSLSHVCVVEGSTKKPTKKNKRKNILMNQLGHWNGHWDCGTDKEKLQVALFSTKLFTEESFFFCSRFFFFFLFSQMKAPDNLWFMASQPSGEFLKVEKTVFFFIIIILLIIIIFN